MNNISNTSKELLSSKDAGAILGYTHDYVSRLCRQNKMVGIQKGREWFVTREEIEAFKGRHEIELQQKKKELSKKFSKIRLEHEAKKRKARAEAALLEGNDKEKKYTTDLPSIQKSIKFKIPNQLVALTVLTLIVFGSTIFDAISKNIVINENSSLLGQVSSSIDKGIQDTIYAQATAVEPVTTAVMSLNYISEGFIYFADSVIELPQMTYNFLQNTGNAYLTLYLLQGVALYEAGLNMNTMGANVLWGYELIGESFYFGAKDIVNLYRKVLHIDSSIERSQGAVENFTANVGEGFKYAKEAITDTFFKKTTSGIIFAFGALSFNVNSNISAMQSNVGQISHDLGLYIGSVFQFNLIEKDSNIRSIEIKD